MSQLDPDPFEETKMPQKPKSFWGKVKQDPLPPLGVAVTAGVLGYGMYSMTTGNAKLSQKMMRARVIAQAATIVALMFSISRTDFKKPPASSSSNFPFVLPPSSPSSSTSSTTGK